LTKDFDKKIVHKNGKITGAILQGALTLSNVYSNVIKNRDINTFVSSWFVTYNRIMVSCVVSGAMNAAAVTQLSGFQIYLATMIVGFVLLNLVMMALRVKKIQ